MRATSIIYRRELATYLRSPIGWIIAAVALLVEGILFEAWGLVHTMLSADLLRQFFYTMSGVTMIMAIILSIRAIADERQSGSLVLLNTSPISDVSVVVGKFLAALTFLAIILALSVYMPLLIQVEGKITTSQILVGYLGLFLLGAGYLAIGLFASSLTRWILIDLVIGAMIGTIMVMFSPLAKVLSPPFSTVLEKFDAWWGHFDRGFMVGILSLDNVVYYIALTYFFLLLTVKTMEAKRWQ